MIASLHLQHWQASSKDSPPDVIVIRMSDCDLWLHREEAIPIAEAIENAADVKSETKRAQVGQSKAGLHLPPRGGWTVREVVAEQSGCLVLRARDGDYWIPNDQLHHLVTALRALDRAATMTESDPPLERRRDITLRRSRHVFVTDGALDAFETIIDAQREELARVLVQWGPSAPKESVAHCEQVLSQMNWLRERIRELRSVDGVLATIDPPPPNLMPSPKEATIKG